MSTEALPRFWNPIRRRLAASFLIGVAAVIVISQWYRVFNDKAQGDIQLHWDFGHRFVIGEFLYKGGHTPYPPFWGMANAVWTLFPKRWAFVLAYSIGVISLGFLVVLLDRMTRRTMPLPSDKRFWATALALALSSRFLIRELPECGPNLLMVALAWGGFALWRQKRDGLGGLCLGLGVSLKCTPALFIPYFALERQWKMVATSTAFAVLFTLAPIVWQGPASYQNHMQTWFRNSLKGVSQSDPSIGALGEEEVWNVSLRPTLARYLMHLPEGHKGRLDTSWRAEWLDLTPSNANRVVKVVQLLILAFVAWRFRRPVCDREDESLLWEASAVSLLILLYSPITWKQHCVGVFPAFYLISRASVVTGKVPRWLLGLLGLYVVFIMLGDRGVVGRDVTLILDGYGAPTWAVLLLLGVVLWFHSVCARNTELKENGRISADSSPPHDKDGGAALPHSVFDRMLSLPGLCAATLHSCAHLPRRPSPDGP